MSGVEKLTEKLDDLKIVAEEASTEETVVTSFETRAPATSLQELSQQSSLSLGFLFDETMILHRSHKHFHVERPERIMAIYYRLYESKLLH